MKRRSNFQITLGLILIFSLLFPLMPNVSAKTETDVRSTPPTVDGEVDESYGIAIASDPAGDGNYNAAMDLLDLYITDDTDHFYFAFSINENVSTTLWGKYVLYIDTTNDSNGATSDAWGRNVNVTDPHKAEFGIYSWVDATPYSEADTQLVPWNGSGWDWGSAGTVDTAALIGGNPSVIEWSVAKSKLGNPEEIWVEVWSTGGGGSDPAQDTINQPANDWNATNWNDTATLSVSTQYPEPVTPPVAAHDNNIWWEYLGHNSRDTLYRNPGGPVTTDTPVTLRLRAASGDLTEAKLRLWNDRLDTQLIINMSLVHDDGTYEWWEATVPASSDPTVWWYRFIPIDGTDTDYYEDDEGLTGGWGKAWDESMDYSYQLTVYDADYETPDWIKNAVVYQVYPDRFRDGDATNNKLAGAFFYDETPGTIYRSLTTDWNEEICDPRAPGDCAISYSKNFYGGDLQGLIDKLDYLQNLGVTAIYLNPIFDSPSNHGYDTTDYMSINPMFGTEAEFNALVSALQTRSMYLILDGVFNHVSSDSIYFDRYGRYTELGACESPSSPYRDWFYFTDVTPGTGTCAGSDGSVKGANYQSWWGYDSLPILNSRNAEVRGMVWDNETAPEETVAGYWMQSADGWRLDVGADVDPGTINDPANDYWEGFRNTVKSVNSAGYITGEEWGLANAWLLGGEWDAVMNYQFSSAVLSLWRDEVFVDNDHSESSSAGTLHPLTMNQFNEKMLNLMERYSPEAFEAMLNLFGSHDTSRVLFMLDHNTDLNDPSVYANPNYDWSDAIERLKGAALVQMTMPGAPTIYYGDEVGLVGPMAYSGGKWEDDPYNRQPFPWLDESGTPFYTHLQSQANQDALYDYYALLTSARNTHPSLRTGDYRALLIDDTEEVFAYGRNLPGEDVAVVLINRSDAVQTVSLDISGYIPNGATLAAVIGSSTYTVDPNGMLNDISVQPQSGEVLVLDDLTLAAPPATILDLMVSSVSGDSISLDWNDVTSASSYLVYRSYLSGGGYDLIGSPSLSNYTDSSVEAGKVVYYIVIAINETTGLISAPSNEVSALPAYTIGWANLQWPFSISKALNTTPTENIYGQVWIDGVTSLPGVTPGLLAQVGFGPDGSNPIDNPDWTWVDAAFNGNSDNNDEFAGQVLPEQIGDYDYVYRYSTDGKATWLYAYQEGPVGEPYTATQAGQLSITTPIEENAPSTPELSLDNWGADFIALSWTQATDDVAVYGYELFRSTDGINYTKLARVMEPTLTYEDGSVSNGLLYYYLVKAIDTSFNFSDYSNSVSHLAEAKMVTVTFNVSVPDFTVGTVTITGDGDTLSYWNPGAIPMNKVDDTHWSKTLNFLDGEKIEFKFARGSWDTVMKDLDGNNELSNLTLNVDYGTDGTQLYEYTVLNWRDPLVTAFLPLDLATNVPLDSVIEIWWSQAMSPAACFTLTGPEGAVSGTCSYDALENKITFTPDALLLPGATYTVSASGLADSVGELQQVPAIFSFETWAIHLFFPVFFN